MTAFIRGEGVALEDQGWLWHPPPSSRIDKTVWGNAEALLHRRGASGTLPSATDPQPVSTAVLRNSRRQHYHQQGVHAVVAAVWEGLPPRILREV